MEKDTGLYSIGKRKASIIKLEKTLKARKFVLVGHGSVRDVQKARDILDTTRADQLGVHHWEESA